MSILKDVENVNKLLKSSQYQKVYDELRSSIGLENNREQLTGLLGTLLYKALDKKVQEAFELVKENEKLIASRVKRFEASGCDPEDLFTIGKFGLIESTYKFNRRFGTKLSTYAVPSIDGHIKRYLTRRFNIQRENECSINEPVFEDDLMLEDTIGTAADAVEEQALLKITKKDLLDAIKRFSKQDRLVIGKRLGLLGGDTTQKAIAEEVGMTQTNVSRIEKKTLPVIIRSLRKKYKIDEHNYIVLKDEKKEVDYERLNNEAIEHFAERYIFAKEKYNGESPTVEILKKHLKNFKTEDLVILVETHGLYDKYERSESDVALFLGLAEKEVRKTREKIIACIQESFGLEKAIVKFKPQGALKKYDFEELDEGKETHQTYEDKVESYSILELRKKLVEENNQKMLGLLDEKPKQRLHKIVKVGEKGWPNKKMKEVSPEEDAAIVAELFSMVKSLKESGIWSESVRALTKKQRETVQKIIKIGQESEGCLSLAAKEIGIDKNVLRLRIKSSMNRFYQAADSLKQEPNQNKNEIELDALENEPANNSFLVDIQVEKAKEDMIKESGQNLQECAEMDITVSSDNSPKETQTETNRIKSEEVNDWTVKLFFKRYVLAGRNDLGVSFDKEKIVGLINGLEQKEFDVLVYLHGLTDGIEKNIKKVSKKLGIPQRTANEYRKNALFKIQKQLNIKPTNINFRPFSVTSYINLSRPETLPGEVKVYNLEEQHRVKNEEVLSGSGQRRV